jgi:heme oxygenase
MPGTESIAAFSGMRRMALKGATRTAHDRVEAISEKGGHFDTMGGYKRYLAATWALRAEFEASLDASGAASVWPFWPERRIAHLVSSDMADLDVPPGQEPIRRFRFDRAELLGALYVLEGSGLGARVIIGRIPHLGLSRDFGARHLYAQAGSPGAWRDFTTLLDNADLSPEEEQACFTAAETTFEAYAFAFRSAYA